MKVIITDWHPSTERAKLLVAHIDVLLPDWGAILHSVTIRRGKEGELQAGMPMAPVVRAGRHLKANNGGGYAYAKTAAFVSKQDYQDFSASVIAAARAAHPEAFK